MWGCTKPVMQPHIFPGDKPMGLCPLGFFRDHPDMEAKAFGLHLHWSKGILPVHGGIDDQAADFETVVVAVEHGVNAGRNRLQEVEHRKAEKRIGAGKTGPAHTKGRRR